MRADLYSYSNHIFQDKFPIYSWLIHPIHRGNRENKSTGKTFQSQYPWYKIQLVKLFMLTDSAFKGTICPFDNSAAFNSKYPVDHLLLCRWHVFIWYERYRFNTRDPCYYLKKLQFVVWSCGPNDLSKAKFNSNGKKRNRRVAKLNLQISYQSLQQLLTWKIMVAAHSKLISISQLLITYCLLSKFCAFISPNAWPYYLHRTGEELFCFWMGLWKASRAVAMNLCQIVSCKLYCKKSIVYTSFLYLGL